MKIGSLCLFFFGFSLFGQDDFDFAKSAISAKGRIEVVANDAVQMQMLSFWSERSLKQLESDWKAAVPFQPGHRFMIRVDPQTEKVTLRQTWSRGALQQVLLLSESSIETEPREVTRAFTRAMAYRVGIEAMPRERIDWEWQVPDWLVEGSAHALLAGRSRLLFEGLVNDYVQNAPPPPEQVMLSGSSGGRVDEQAAALLCRWLFSDEADRSVWERISRGDFRQAEDWTRLRPSIGSLRELHQQWDVWWLAERKVLIAEYAMENAARESLKAESRFVPAYYGLFVEGENRYQEMGFSGLEVYLDDPRFGVAMQEWILRLQRLRFRQSEAFNEQVEALQEAGRLAIQASEQKGKKRKRLWQEAVAKISN